MSQFNVKTSEMVETQFSACIEGTIALVMAVLAFIRPERTERTEGKRITLPANNVPLPYVPVLLTDADRWFPSQVDEAFNRDGYPIDETTFAGSGLAYTAPVVQPVKASKARKATVRKGKPAKLAAQAVETERPTVKPVKARKSKASKPVVPALPPAPTERRAIQALAKQHGIKANGKSEDIIRQLREKGIVA